MTIHWPKGCGVATRPTAETTLDLRLVNCSWCRRKLLDRIKNEEELWTAEERSMFDKAAKIIQTQDIEEGGSVFTDFDMKVARI